MIIDKFEQLSMYSSLLNNLESGMEAIKEQMDAPKVGRYEFEGGYFMVQKGETMPMEEGLFEAHKKYVDVQIIVEGSEELAWADIKDLVCEVPYSEEKDALFLSGNCENHMKMTRGMFYIAFPHDAHRPIRHTGTPQHFTKVVMKLPV